MKILGIHWEHCSTAALTIDGRVEACVSEERFSRRKNDDSYPLCAIEYCLRAGGVRAQDLDVVAIASERWNPTYILCHRPFYSVEDRLREQRDYWYPRLYERLTPDYLALFAEKVDTAQFPGNWDPVLQRLRAGHGNGKDSVEFFQSFRRAAVSRHLGVPPEKVVFINHHSSHAHYAYFGSPATASPALVLTADAWGDDMNATVSVAEHGDIRLRHTSANFNLARLYRSITLLLGMKPDEHEFKVMGLAPYCKPAYSQGPLDVFRSTQFVNGLGFSYHTEPPDLYLHFQKRLEGFRFDAIAAGVQRYCEELITGWVRNCVAATQARHVCFGGGLAMNVKAMMEVAKLEEVESVFVCPSPSDESLALGACYAAMTREAGSSGEVRPQPLPNAYLGPEVEAPHVRSVVDGLWRDGFHVIEHATPDCVAEALAAGKLVGRCAGRSEFGSRSLGNRSILADPRDLRTVARLNEKVKSRDFWMPFAPSIREERSDDYLVNPKGLRAPYMTLAFDTTEAARRDLSATLHSADSTARAQIVSGGDNPSYHAIISAFDRLTGVGGVLNTSFNIHGEPIVQSAADAADVFRRSDLDAVLLGDVLVEKRPSAQ